MDKRTKEYRYKEAQSRIRQLEQVEDKYFKAESKLKIAVKALKKFPQDLELGFKVSGNRSYHLQGVQLNQEIQVHDYNNEGEHTGVFKVEELSPDVTIVLE